MGANYNKPAGNASVDKQKNYDSTESAESIHVKNSIRVLIVEDDQQQREIICAIVEAQGHQVSSAKNAEEAILSIKKSKDTSAIDVVFCDWKLGKLSGLDVLNYARTHTPMIGFAIATAYGTIAHAVQAIEAGADDYLAKPFQRQELLLCIDKANKARLLRQQNEKLHEQLSEQHNLVDLVGNAPCMQGVYKRIEKVSPTNATVLITGESGTGKELAARALHHLSPRQKNVFVAVNCGAIPESLAEAELFGARKGAYTGAVKDSMGLLQRAHGGSLFLDEIGELSLPLQTKLLRFLQESTITPVGDSQELHLDVRVIAATHRNLSKMVDNGEFREDLYYRLNIVPIEMPPLRERAQDIPMLIEFFLKKYQHNYQLGLPELNKHTLKALMDYHWPGNVRELSNRIERLVLLGDEENLIQEMSSKKTGQLQSENQDYFTLPEAGLNWDKFEKNCLQQAMDKFEGNRTLAARHLGMTYKRFVYRLNKFNLS